MVSQQSKDFLPIKVASCQKYVHCASDIQQEKSKEKVKKVNTSITRTKFGCLEVDRPLQYARYECFCRDRSIMSLQKFITNLEIQSK
ncbi:CLUMA_CG002837, isoform A [Clunio marinus]|uniref:CLUMA_CG002837, isoform A n=1 Tax=Clunio marinus TaxID=568069 RepID=A0A1J1HMA4_9DIPT|nr:CLUMA_CG002837, isoform A [Clunio marinus]